MATNSLSPLSRPARFYTSLVVATGTAILGLSVASLISAPPPAEWLVLAGLALLSGAFNIKVPGIPARISIAEAFVFATVLLYGPAAATVVVALDAVVSSLRARNSRKALYRRVPFNVSAAALAIWVSAQLFLLAVRPHSSAANLPLDQFVLPLAGLAFAYFVLNSGLVAVAMSLERGEPAYRLWRTNFLWLGLNYLGGASFAALIVTYRQQFDLAMISVIVPLLVITYFTFRTAMDRLEDANRHVGQLNELYLSTIETLAMAVDAKDQITHGHIRRVQVYATELARRLGVREQSQIRAIEAAALLHDMGKLAIPENILNKPGRLSTAEFDKMKSHAGIGADLLSAIRFPYPVVPIVRHHHEFWDGNGYPSGISRTDIPLGARILAVVDCFDALTSDRPYRPRLSTEDAFAVLHDRRGTVYDPMVVDAFVEGYAEIAPLAIAAGQQARSLIEPGYFDADPVQASMPLQQIRENAAETSRLFQVARTLAHCTTPSEAFEPVAQYVREQTPATICAFFVSGARPELLECKFASGDGAEFLIGLSIARGERITGWTAERGQTISNSDPALDLGNIARSFRQPLKSTLSSPVICGGRTLGVLTAYSPLDDAFTPAHCYSVEQVTTLLGEQIARLHGQAGRPVIPFPKAGRGTPHPFG